MKLFRSRQARHTSPKRPHGSPFRPRVELLEDRRTPSAGFLDTTTFNAAGPQPGTAKLSVNGGQDYAMAVAVYPASDTTGNAGKIVTAGSSNKDFVVARYNTDGTLDTTFGTGGVVTTDFAGGTDTANAVLIDAASNLVVAGSSYQIASNHEEVALARYTSNGALDTTFGTGGKTLALSGTNAWGNAAAFDGAGAILVAGEVDGKFALSHYSAGGSLDITYGSGGWATAKVGSLGGDSARALAVQSDGKVDLAGRTNGSSGGDGPFAVARFTATGTLDTSFGPNGTGTLTTAIGSKSSPNDTAWAVALDPVNGSIVVAGAANMGTASSLDYAVTRYTPAGLLDGSFGSGGIVTFGYGVRGGSDIAHGLAVQPDEKVVLAGEAATSGGTSFGLARLTKTGQLDSTFGTSGKTTTAFTGVTNARGRAVALQGNGQSVVAGYASTSTGSALALARYQGDQTATRLASAGVSPLGSSTSFQAAITPQQIRHAYGFDQLFPGVYYANAGLGQTIAIVDACHDPNIFKDLAKFDTQFGLPGTDATRVSSFLTHVNQHGGTSYPRTDAGWALEIAIDVE